jgi:hypothetical protein
MSKERCVGRLAVVLVALVTGTTPLVAQSLQRVSVQGSGALVFPTASESDFRNTTRLGWEGQLRYTFSRFSVGAGYQWATVYRFETGDFSGAVGVVFVEPRYVLAAGSGVALYLAGRVGAGQLFCTPKADCASQSFEPTFGAGGGLLFRISRRVSADLGSQFFSTQYTLASGDKTRTGYVLARLGLSVGLF